MQRNQERKTKLRFRKMIIQRIFFKLQLNSAQEPNRRCSVLQLFITSEGLRRVTSTQDYLLQSFRPFYIQFQTSSARKRPASGNVDSASASHGRPPGPAGPARTQQLAEQRRDSGRKSVPFTSSRCFPGNLLPTVWREKPSPQTQILSVSVRHRVQNERIH